MLNKEYILKLLKKEQNDQFLELGDVLTISGMIDLIEICLKEKDC